MNVERALGIISLLVGILALGLSWQANQIARDANKLADQQFKSQIVVLDTQESISGYGPSGLICMQIVRFANLGAAPDSIISYSAVIFYGDRQLTADSEGNTIAFNRDRIIPGIGDFYMRFIQAPNVWPSDIDDVETLNIPLKIDAYTTSDVTINFRYYVDTGNYDIESHRRIVSGSLQKVDPPAEYTPIEVAYTIEMASGQFVEVPKIPCYYFKPK